MFILPDEKLQIGVEVEYSQVKPAINDLTDSISKASSNMQNSFKTAITNMDSSSSKLQGTFSQLTGSASSMGDGLRNIFSSLESSMGGLLSVAGKISGIMAGAALFGSAVSSTKEYYTEIYKLSTQLGITSQQASALDLALEHTGISTEEYLGAANAMTRQLATGAKGFETLGIETKNADGSFKNSQSLLMDVAEVLKNTEAGTSRNVAAIEIFKRSHIDIAKFSKLSGEAMEEAAQKAEELGLMVGPQQMANFSAYLNAQRQLHTVFEALSVNIGGTVLPVLAKFGLAIATLPSTINSAITSIKGWIDAHQDLINSLTTVLELVGAGIALYETYTLGVYAITAAKTTWAAITGIVATIVATVSTAVEIATAATALFTNGCFAAAVGEAAMSAGLTVLIGAVVAIGVAVALLATAWYTNFNGIRDATSSTVNDIGEMFVSLWNQIKTIGDGIFKVLQGAFTLNVDLIKEGVNEGITAASTAWSTMGSIGRTAWDGIKTAGVLAWDGIKTAASSAMSSIGVGGVPVTGGATPAGGTPFVPPEKGAAGGKDHSAEEAKKAAAEELKAKKDEIATKEAFDKLYVAENSETALQAAENKVKYAQQETEEVKELFGDQSKEYAETKLKEVEAAKAVIGLKVKAAKESADQENKISDDKLALEEELDKESLDRHTMSQVQFDKIMQDHENIRYNIALKGLQDQKTAADGSVDDQTKIQNQIDALQAKHALTAQQLSANTTKAMSKNWDDLSNKMVSSLDSAFQGIAKGTASFGSIMKSIGDTILQHFTQIWAQTAVQHLLGNSKETAGETAKQSTLTSIASAGETARIAVAKTGAMAASAASTGVATAMVSTSTAAFTALLAMITATASAIATIPPAGPAMAAAMFAGVGVATGSLAAAAGAATGAIAAAGKLSSFDVGTMSVANDGLANIHKDEMIVPAKSAAPFRDFLSGGSGIGGGSFSHNPTYNITANNAIDFKSMLSSHARTVADLMAKQERRGFTPNWNTRRGV